MLYHFPDESAEELLEQERSYLENQFKRADRVKTHGYRPKEPVLSSFFIEWQCINNYLRCPIEKWSWPWTSKDKVELEAIPSDFLPPVEYFKPLTFIDPETKERTRRVVGFREIQQKREYLEFLREVEVEMGYFWGSEDNDEDGEGVEDLVRINIDDSDDDSEDNGGEITESEAEVESEEEEEVVEEATYYKSLPFLRMARGGGGGDKDKRDKEKSKKDKDKDKDKEKEKGKREKDKDKEKDKGKKDKDKDKKKDSDKKEKSSKKDKDKGKDRGGKHRHKKKSGEDEGIIEKIWNYFVDPIKKSKKTREKDEKDKKRKDKDKDSKKNRRKSNEEAEGWSLAHLWKDLERQKVLMEKEQKVNLEKIFKYHGLFRVKAARERDSEWLELSDTDPDEQGKVIKSFEKPNTTWMVDGISFESQYLARTLRFFRFMSILSGRSIVKVRPAKDKGHMDFTHRKRDVTIFSATSFLLWLCFSLMVFSFLAIQWENQSKSGPASGSGSASGPSTVVNVVNSAEELQDIANVARHDVEELQLNLYEIPLYVFLINLVLVAIWSILVLLGDGIFIAHYFNCWCAALAEMETSGCLGLKKLIYKQHIQFIIYTGILITCFYCNYPIHVRQSALLICALILRPLKPHLRIETDENLLKYEVGGLVFQVYVMYCTTLIKLLMKILATILRNASEMWNFKFALTFQQLSTKNRGQLLRMGLNHSLLKLFTHHRILTVLLRNYGEVFSLPVMIYMVCEMAVITVALVRWFFYKEETADSYKGNTHIIIQTDRTSPYRLVEEIKIPYFHPRDHVHMTLYLMMFQVLIQFLSTTDLLAKSGDSFFAGYEFVRRSGTILCRNSHQRRLIQSLEWSFSSTNPSVLSANSFFAINRASILSSFAAVAGFFSLIIQLQVETEFTVVKFLTLENCSKFDMELYRGGCVLKPRESGDPSIDFGAPAKG